MSSILIILFLIFYLVLACSRIDWAVMVLIGLLPSYLIRFHIFGVPVTLLEAMILVAFAVWFLKNIKQIFHNIKSKIVNSRATVPFGRLWRDSEGRYPFDIEIILLLIVSYGAVAVAGFSASALGIWKAYFFEPLLVYILVMNVFNVLPSLSSGLASSAVGDEAKASKPELKLGRILWPLAVSAFAVSVFAIYQKFTGAFITNPFWAAEETRRVTSFFDYPNAVGLFLGPVIMVLFGWMFALISIIKSENKIFNFPARGWSPARGGHGASGGQFSIFKQFSIFNFKNLLSIILIGLTVIISLLSIYFAKSEGALIGIAAGLIIFGLLAGKKARRATVILLIVLTVGIAAYPPARNKAIEKLTLSDLSGEIRKQQWRETWQMLTASPSRFVLGAGLDNYRTAVKPYHQEGIFFNSGNDPDFQRKVVFNEEYRLAHWQPVEIYMYPHNIILNFWSELGLAGMLLFIWIIAKFFYDGFKLIIKNQNQKSLLRQSFFPETLPEQEIVIPPVESEGERIENRKSKIENSYLKDKFIIIGLISSMAVIVVHGTVDVPYFKNDLAVMFWIIIAATAIIKLKYQSYESY